LQFRAEFFNILNHPDWGQPQGGVFTQGFTPTGSPVYSISPTAAQITTLANNMRQVQVALRLMF
jgi:hypothetical protein